MNSSPTQPPVVAVIVNPVHAHAMPALVAALRTAESMGWEPPLVLRTTVDSPGAAQARQALEAGADRVLVIGGDGTVRQVADVLAGTECVLGIVPTGTANLAARNLGLNELLTKTVDHLVTSALTTAGDRIDVGRATWRTAEGLGRGTFLMTAGLGHDAAIISGVGTAEKERHGWRAYVRPALRRLDAAGWPLRVDGREVRPWSLLITNSGSIPLGIGVSGARLDDGTLHVVAVDPDPLLEWFTIALAGLLPGAQHLPGIDRRDTPQTTVVPDSPTPAHLDGDPLGEVWELSASVDPGALLVARPRPAGRAAPTLDEQVLATAGPAGIVAIINALREGGITAGEREEVTLALTALEGEELQQVKYLLNSGGDGHDLEHFVYDVLDGGQRRRVLDHIAEQAVPHDELRVLCDIDDTFKSNLHDDRYDRGTVYPGIVEFLRALDASDAAGDDHLPGDLTFVTARPGGVGDLIERYTRRGFTEHDLPAHTIMTGSLRGLLDRGRMAGGKVTNIRRDAALFPECRQVFIGDSGQADADVALKVRRRWPEHLVASFIHCVTDVDEATRASWREEGVYAVDDYAQAARIAGELGLIDADRVARVEQAVEQGVPGLPR
ncbi:diacylglycerol kinase family protein [Kytococcus sedentarius]|uniref:diacylglycerol kinase family protein n=1 Tax=Kytococcus sedentarius TaxID=1276 RepID=UPI0035BC6986